MIQQQFEFFWSLTEQIDLDLDFTPCVEYAKKKYEANSLIAGNGLCLTIGAGGVATWSGTLAAAPQSLANMTEFHPTKESVGYWLVGSNLRYYMSKKPNWLVRLTTKFMLGWEWGDN